jgi:TonB family protein
MKSATGAQIKNAIAFSALVHAAMFCLVLFMMRLPDHSFFEGNCIAVDLILPSGKQTATAPGSYQPQAAIQEESRQPELPDAAQAARNNIPEDAGPAGQYETQTAARSGGQTGKAGQGIVAYQPFHRLEKVPSFKIQKDPAYPLAARSAGVETRVVVEVYINDQGNVDDVKLIKSGGAGFDEAVIEAVQGSSFEPGMKDGRTVASKVQIPYIFKLK